jgi:2-hydroxychromene-2-carboxylate isomerase
MGLQADVFWSFRSPYSYLATRRYRALAEQYDLTINLRPVYPLAIREPDFFERSHPNWLRYTFTDMFRVAQFHGIPFGPPRPDPIVQDVGTRKIAEEQPYIFRLTRLGQAAARRGKSLAFCDEASRLIWGGAENWHEGDHLAGAAARAGRNRCQSSVSRSIGALGCPDFGVRRRALFWPRPHRYGRMADAAKGTGFAISLIVTPP